MKKTIDIPVKEKIVFESADIVYMHKKGWCNVTNRQLKLSILCERACAPYDTFEKRPLLVWLCGGGFTGMSETAWLPELTYFAKNGYVVASVSYSCEPDTVFPEPEKEVKAAIRYLRAHADDYLIDVNRVVVAGESAGAYLAAFVGLSGEMPDYEEGDYQEYSSKVNAVITWYAPVALKGIPEKRWKRPDLTTLVDHNAPPILMLHGLCDSLVPCKQSELLYEAYQKTVKRADLYLIENADHGALQFIQDETKKIMLDFMNDVLE